MEYRHEIVNFGTAVPLKIFLHKIGYVEHHWHKSLELLLILDGKVEVTVNQRHYDLTEDDVILINSNEIHSLSSEECVMVAVQISPEMFEHAPVDAGSLHFDCNSAGYVNRQQFDTIKIILANMLKTGSGADETSALLNQSLAYRLLYELVHNFRSDQSVPSENSARNLDRIQHITEYIHQNYMEPLTLSSIAANEFISVPYLSKYFEKHMGVTLLNYITRVRLTHAVNELLYSDHSIEDIAYSCGFPNARSFASSFKKEYQVLPSQYRRMARESRPVPEHAGPSKVDYLDLDTHNYLHRLAAYLDKEPDTLQPAEPILQTPAIIVDTNVQGQALRHTFLRFISVGRAKEILFAPIQRMLRTIQHEIGFEYIKFHGILGDDMMVYDEDAQGTPSYNFYYVDQVIDFLQSIHLRPLIQLSFMPKALAQTPERTRFYSPFTMGAPKDWDRWEALVHTLTAHLISRYGLEEVETWLFCPWNEPDTTTAMYGFESDEVFYELHRRSYRGVKSCSETLQFGGASMQPLFHIQHNFGREYTRWCQEHGCPLDFININFYDLNFEDKNASTIWEETSRHQIQLSQDPDSFSKFITKITNHLRQDGVRIPVYLTEWNSTASHSDLMSDTCYKSVYIVKNILENIDRLDSYGYWVLSDLHEEYRLPDQMFHGGLGLFTYNEVKKPGYYAYWLLSKLGSELLARGNGYFVTRDRAGLQIMLYYYQHFSAMYAMGETYDMTFTDRYTPFAEDRKREQSIALENLPNGTYLIQETYVNRKSGSSYDKWVEMGALPLDADEVHTLQALSTPLVNKYMVTVTDHTLHYSVVLEPLEIRLVQIRPQ